MSPVPAPISLFGLISPFSLEEGSSLPSDASVLSVESDSRWFLDENRTLYTTTNLKKGTSQLCVNLKRSMDYYHSLILESMSTEAKNSGLGAFDQILLPMKQMAQKTGLELLKRAAVCFRLEAYCFDVPPGRDAKIYELGLLPMKVDKTTKFSGVTSSPSN